MHFKLLLLLTCLWASSLFSVSITERLATSKKKIKVLKETVAMNQHEHFVQGFSSCEFCTVGDCDSD